MSVTRDDVKQVAALARLAVSDERADVLAVELNSILGHMRVLERVETDKLEPVVGVGAASAPLAPDQGPSVALASPIEQLGPEVRDGFFIVPRLATHESRDEA